MGFVGGEYRLPDGDQDANRSDDLGLALVRRRLSSSEVGDGSRVTLGEGGWRHLRLCSMSGGGDTPSGASYW